MQKSFRTPLAFLLSEPSKDNFFFSNEILLKKRKKAFVVQTRNSKPVKIVVSVSSYQSKNGTRWIAYDEDEDILASAFVNKRNVLIGIITNWGYVNIGIGKALILFIKKKNKSLSYDTLMSEEGHRLIAQIA